MVKKEVFKFLARNFGIKDDRIWESIGYMPHWYSEVNKYKIYGLASDLVIYISEAEAIHLSYNMKKKNKDLRIEYFSRAISSMRALLECFWDIWKDYPYNLNYLRIFLQLCDQEMELLTTAREYTYRYKIKGKT